MTTKPVQVKTWAGNNRCIPRLMNGLTAIRQIAAAKAYEKFATSDFTHDILYNIWVAKNDRLTATCGRAFYLQRRIELHPVLYDKNDPIYNDRFDTFFHEVSHFAAKWYFKEAKHGMMWKVCMLAFGYEPDRCFNPHKFDGLSYRKYQERAADRLLDGMEFEI